MDQLQIAGSTIGFRRCGLSAGTTNTFTTAIDYHYAIRGQTYVAAPLANFAGPAVDVNTGAAFIPVGPNKAGVFVFVIDGSGTFATATKVAQGAIVDLDGSADAANANYVSRLPEFPAVSDNMCVYGWCVVKVGASGSPWTFGTSNNSGVANTTVTFTSGVCLPDRPRG